VYLSRARRGRQHAAKDATTAVAMPPSSSLPTPTQEAPDATPQAAGSSHRPDDADDGKVTPPRENIDPLCPRA